VKGHVASPLPRIRITPAPENYDDTAPAERFRYQVQVCFPVPGEVEHWDTISFFPSPMEALRGCSQWYDTIRDLLGIEFCKDLTPGYLKIRILDAMEQRLILWEVESGGLVEAFTEEDCLVPRCNTKGDGA